MSTDPSQLGAVITDPRARRAVYGTYVVLTVIAGATTVGVAVLGALPTWVVVMNTVLAFLGAPIGSLALANMQVARKSATPDDEPDIGQLDQ